MPRGRDCVLPTCRECDDSSSRGTHLRATLAAARAARRRRQSACCDCSVATPCAQSGSPVAAAASAAAACHGRLRAATAAAAAAAADAPAATASTAAAARRRGGGGVLARRRQQRRRRQQPGRAQQRIRSQVQSDGQPGLQLHAKGAPRSGGGRHRGGGWRRVAALPKRHARGRAVEGHPRDLGTGGHGWRGYLQEDQTLVSQSCWESVARGRHH
eukprot:355182-Chlamydomonas_euryale.AAC.3